MIDLGGFDARATVPSGAEEQARVFAEHRARVAALARELTKEQSAAILES